MDEFKDVESTNETWNYVPETTITTVQIITLIWSLICLIPNVILIYLIVKSALYRKNFHLVMFHWTIVNLISVAILLGFSAIPEYYTFHTIDSIVVIVASNIRMVAAVLATFFIFDKYVRSEKFCLYSIYTIWTVFISLSIIVIFCLSFGFRAIILIFPAIMLLKFLSVLTFTIRSILYWIRGSDEETYKLRLILSGIFIILNCVQWFYDAVYFVATLSTIIRVFLIIMFYANGYFNLALLVRYDPRIRIHFHQLFSEEIDYLNVKFSRKKSDMLSTVEANEAVPVADEVKP